MKQNIDAWWSAIENGAEAIVITASGCGPVLKDYCEALKHDADYAQKAHRVSTLACDLSEFLAKFDLQQFKTKSEKRVAFHSPCSLQHGQKLNGAVESILSRLGYTLTNVPDSHLCCGSAGTYSILQAELSQQLLRNKVNALQSDAPHLIVTANIGCQLHIGTDTALPVKHWIELLDGEAT